MEVIEVLATAYRGILDQKTYVVAKGDEAVIIDAGADLVDVKKAVQGRKVLAVLITHCHFDHIWCIEDYIKEWNVPVFISKGAEDKFLDSDKNCSNIIRNRTTFNVNQDNIKYFEDRLKIGDFEIEVIKTPGHSADSVSFLIEKSLFTGDLVLGGGIGRTDLYDSNDRDMWDSLEKLEKLDFEMAYPGHYEPMTKQETLRCFKYDFI